MTPKTRVIIYHESIKASIIKDTYSLGLLILVLVLNYFLAENNWTINALVAFLALVFSFGKSSRIDHITTPEDLKLLAETLIACDKLDESLKKLLDEIDKAEKRNRKDGN